MYQNYQHLDFGYRGRILTVTMNRPEVRNAANEIPPGLAWRSDCEVRSCARMRP